MFNVQDNGIFVNITDDEHRTAIILKTDIKKLVYELQEIANPRPKIVYDKEGKAYKNGKHVCCHCGEPYVRKDELSCSACMAD